MTTAPKFVVTMLDTTIYRADALESYCDASAAQDQGETLTLITGRDGVQNRETVALADVDTIVVSGLAGGWRIESHSKF